MSNFNDREGDILKRLEALGVASPDSSTLSSQPTPDLDSFAGNVPDLDTLIERLNTPASFDTGTFTPGPQETPAVPTTPRTVEEAQAGMEEPTDAAVTDPKVREYLEQKSKKPISEEARPARITQPVDKDIYSDDISDSALAAAQQTGRNQALAANLGRAISGGMATVSGVKSDPGLYESLVQQSGRRAKDIQQRRKMMDFQRTAEAKEEKRDQARALRDPSSRESQTARERYKTFFPGRGDEVNGKTALEIADMLKDQMSLQEMRLKAEELDIKRAKAEGAGKDKKEKFSGDQNKAASFGRRMEQAEEVFAQLKEKDFNRAGYGTALGKTLLPEVLETENMKRQDQAERNFINATLRRESGAAIADSEFASAELQYFPRAGDTQEVIDQKRRNREQVIAAMRSEAGGAYDRLPLISSGAPKKNTVRVRDPQGKIRLIPSDRLEDALKAGGERVE